MADDDDTKIFVRVIVTAAQERKIQKAIRRAVDLWGCSEGEALERITDFWLAGSARRER